MALSVADVISICLSQIGGLMQMPALKSRLEGRIPCPQIGGLGAMTAGISSAFGAASSMTGGSLGALQSSLSGGLMGSLKGNIGGISSVLKGNIAGLVPSVSGQLTGTLGGSLTGLTVGLGGKLSNSLGSISSLQAGVLGSVSSSGLPFSSASDAFSSINSAVSGSIPVLQNPLNPSLLSAATSITGASSALSSIIADPLHPLNSIAVTAQAALDNTVLSHSGVSSHISDIIGPSFSQVVALSNPSNAYPAVLPALTNFNVTDFTSSLDTHSLVSAGGSAADNITNLITNPPIGGNISTLLQTEIDSLNTHSTAITSTVTSDVNNIATAKAQLVTTSQVSLVAFAKNNPVIASGFIDKVLNPVHSGAINILGAVV